MKKRGFITLIRQGGVLHWSTACILAAGAAGLTGCREKSYTATEEDARMAQLQKKLDELDAQKARLASGELVNNFELPGVGFYHAAARDFFPHAYGFQKDGKWYADGTWRDTAPVASVSSSRPTPEALKKVDLALEREQKLLQQNAAAGGGTATAHHHSSGMGNALMMYWLLSGNRGGFTPGAGFQQATTQAGSWQRTMDNDRRTVGSYAAGNPGYRRMVEQSRTTGTPVRPGQSVRGGFGSSGTNRVSSGS